MLESQLRHHFARLADREEHLPNVSIAAACRRGRKLLRWRRVGMGASPVLAASAVVAVSLAGVLPSGPSGTATRGQRPASPRAGSVTVPRQFSPLVPYASFGWLPPGGQARSGGNGTVTDLLNLYVHGQFAWQLSTYAGDVCRIKGGAGLVCTLSGQAMQLYPLAGRAPSVGGRPAFWTRLGRRQSVAWRYAANAWAVLGNAKGIRQSTQTLLRIADAVKFGARGRVIEFAAQLTGVPATWRISSDTVRQVGGTELAYQYFFAATGSNPADLPFMTVSPGRGSCYFYPAGQSVHRVISGYHVVVNTIPAARGNPTTYQLCAPDADGLFVFISVDGAQPVIYPVTLFRHMKLFGTNPAAWSTQPTG